MGQDVCLDAGPLLKHFAADGTGHNDVRRVENPVDVEAAGLAETLPTVITLEGLLLGVDVPVVTQVVLPPKGLATHITGKWPLIRMGPLMDEQVVGLSELPVAELANEPFLGPC